MKNSLRLQEAGLKSTPLRMAIFTVFEKNIMPIDIPSLLEILKKKSIAIDRATVFRIVNLFTEAGVTKKIEFGEGKFRYELADRPHHHHLICKSCSSIEDIEVKQDLTPEEKRIAKEMKFLVTDHALEFYGLCKNCQTI